MTTTATASPTALTRPLPWYKLIHQQNPKVLNFDFFLLFYLVLLIFVKGRKSNNKCGNYFFFTYYIVSP